MYAIADTARRCLRQIKSAMPIGLPRLKFH